MIPITILLLILINIYGFLYSLLITKYNFFDSKTELDYNQINHILTTIINEHKIEFDLTKMKKKSLQDANDNHVLFQKEWLLDKLNNVLYDIESQCIKIFKIQYDTITIL